MAGVTITTTGATFSPVIALVASSTATVTWTCAGFGNQTGITPSFSFGSAATRSVNMTVTGGFGGYADVTVFNVGYDNTQDTGLFSIGPGFNKAPEAISAISGINTLTGLTIFCAADTACTSSLDFTGCSALQYIECFGANITGVTLTGCSSLIRCDAEQTNISAIDLNPVSSTLKDLRAAVLQGGVLTFATLTSPMAQEYHFCCRENLGGLINKPTPAQLPVVQQFWIWDTNETGAFTFASTSATQVEAEGNHYTSADLTNQFPPANGSLPTAPLMLDLSFNSLASINLTGCSGLRTISLQHNLLGQAAVDGVLAAVAGWGTSSGTLDLTFNTGPSNAGLASKATLTGRGWTVHTDAAPVAPVPPYRLMDGVNTRPGVSSAGTQPPGSSTDNQAGGICAGTGFQVSRPGLFLAGFWLWRADVTQSASASFVLWQVTGRHTGTVVGSTAASVTGMTAAAWNYAPLTVPVALAANTPYVAVSGQTGTHPLTFNQFQNAAPYNNGITNGPVTAWSDVPGSNPDPFGNPQGLFISGGGSNPATAFPQNGNGGAIFWVDVQIAGPPPVPAPQLAVTRTEHSGGRGGGVNRAMRM